MSLLSPDPGGSIIDRAMRSHGESRMNRTVPLLAAFLVLASCASTPSVDPAVRGQLAPTGVLRAAVNFGNVSLVQKDPAGGDPRGVAPDIARELARRLGVPIRYVIYDTAGKVTDAVREGAWDVAFLAVDPEREKTITFSAPYVELGGTYAVRKDSPLRKVADFDRPGTRIAVGKGSAYDLFLSRTLKSAELVRAPTSPAAVELFNAQKLDAVAGIRELMSQSARRDPNLRVIEDNYVTIGQAVCVPRGRDAAAEYVRKVVEELKASGFVAASLKSSGSEDATVAPAAK
jgi:polar amino acid transport system substrate-binding protein